MAEVHEMLTQDYSCDVSQITTQNSQANTKDQQVHQTIGNMIRKWFANDPDLERKDPYNSLLKAVAFATRTTIHMTLDTSVWLQCHVKRQISSQLGNNPPQKTALHKQEQ